MEEKDKQEGVKCKKEGVNRGMERVRLFKEKSKIKSKK